HASVTLINLNPVSARSVTIQGGAYAEHRIESVTMNDKRVDVNGPTFDVRLHPGCGARLRLTMRRYANQPTLKFPWRTHRRV
ncbi:MAG: hypothetical protein ABW171_12930, partial [Steroidobacter sp.]